ncbi:MAG: cbb3-type cytochrome c oxidase subunit 3 [Dichotomicrobium sp.]
MDYETVVMISQIAALLLFIGLFVAVLIYVFWPGNRKRFERASRMPLEESDKPQEDNTEREANGRET